MAFSKNGRIDVDRACKWLISAAVDKAVESLSNEIADATSRAGSQLTAALVTLRSKAQKSQVSETGRFGKLANVFFWPITDFQNPFLRVGLRP